MTIEQRYRYISNTKHGQVKKKYFISALNRFIFTVRTKNFYLRMNNFEQRLDDFKQRTDYAELWMGD